MEFRKLFNETFFEALKLLQGPFWTANEFCHYTNLCGLIGIIENNEIWLSDHRFVNDEIEYVYGKELATAVVSEIMDLEEDSGFKGFLSELLKRIAESSENGIYIGSMSFSADKLDQWKGYGNSGESVCIVFNGNFELWNAGNSHPSHIQQQKIVYSESEQKERIRKIIQIYKNKFIELKEFSFPFIGDLAWLIERQYILFKHEEYASENELRITIENLDHILVEKKPKFRVSKGMLIPYITTKYISKEENPSLNKLPIKEIIASPTSRPELIQSIRLFMNTNGYQDVQVRKSNIRYRG